eukprot:5968292-Prymnesium_polylepis.1
MHCAAILSSIEDCETAKLGENRRFKEKKAAPEQTRGVCEKLTYAPVILRPSFRSRPLASLNRSHAAPSRLPRSAALQPRAHTRF